MAVFIAWLGCSTSSCFGLPLFTKLCERPEVSVAWPLFEEKFEKYVCHFLGALSPGRQACASAWHDWISFPKVSTRMQRWVPLKGNVSGYSCNPCSQRENEMLRPFPMPSACLFTSPQTRRVGDVFSRCPFYTFGSCLWHHGPCGPIGLELFYTCFRYRSRRQHSPKCPPGRSVSCPLGEHGYMSNPRRNCTGVP